MVCNSSTFQTSKLTLDGTCSLIYNSLFILLSSVYGGALQCSSSGIVLRIYDSSFISCSATSGGGGIYVKSSGAQFGIIRVCFDGCKTTSTFGNAVFSDVYATGTSYNNYSSMVYCVRGTPTSPCTYWHDNGICNLLSLNISDCVSTHYCTVFIPKPV